MGLPVDDVTALARSFALSYRVVGATVYVRPAIIDAVTASAKPASPADGW